MTRLRSILEFAMPIASKRDVDIISKEAAERHMPATPEVLNAERLIGRVEVLRKLDVEQQRSSDGHVRIAAKIII